MEDHYLKKLILVLNFINFIPLVSNSFNVGKIYQCYPHIFDKFMPFFT